MKKMPFLYLFFLGVLLIKTFPSFAMSQCAQPYEDPSASEETPKSKTLAERHKHHAEHIQHLLAEQHVHLAQDIRSAPQDLSRYYEILSQIEDLERKEARLKNLYKELQLNYEAPDAALLTSRTHELDLKKQDLLKRIADLSAHPSLLPPAQNLLRKHQNTVVRISHTLEELSHSPQSYHDQIDHLTKLSKVFKKRLKASETFFNEVDALLKIKVSTNVSINAFCKKSRKKLPEDRAISQARVLSILSDLRIPQDIFESIYPQSLYRIILGAIEGLDPLEEDQKNDPLDATLQTVRMMIGNFRLKFQRDFTAFTLLISWLSKDLKELSDINDQLNPREQDLYKSLISPEFESAYMERENIFAPSASPTESQEAFLEIFKKNLSSESSLLHSTSWLPYAIPRTKAGMMHRIIGAFHQKTYHSWEEFQDTSDIIITLPPMPTFSGPKALTHVKAPELFLSLVHDILAHHVNLEILTHMEQSLSSLLVEPEAPLAAEETLKQESVSKRSRVKAAASS
ncbi:MAG: hypothetical protein JSS34_03550 [Proteobacteria bacterium]|nr:hypothetical protein [Pseudomonadota bacterium]